MKLIGLKAKFPSIPFVWIGFILWFTLLGSLILGLSPWVVYSLLALLFIDKVFLVMQFFAAVATAKATGYMLEAMIATQLLMDEQSVSHMKMQHREGE